jgi:hypothetical protein
VNIFGWQISRETLAKIETRIRWVSDFEMVCLAAAFGLSAAELLPSDCRRKSKELLRV